MYFVQIYYATLCCVRLFRMLLDYLKYLIYLAWTWAWALGLGSGLGLGNGYGESGDGDGD